MRLAVISFTIQGSRINETLVRRFRQMGAECTGYVKTRFADEVRPLGLVPVEEPLTQWTGRMFGCLPGKHDSSLSNDRTDDTHSQDGVIFIGAAGIAVRAIAPYLKDKMTDPGVVVIDELGRFSISILSGHVGGANNLAWQAAEILGAVPVVTTATDINRRFAIDVFAREQGLVILDREQAKLVSADILNGIPVGFFSDIPIEGGLPEGFTQKEMCRRNVWITWKLHPEPDSLCGMFLGEDGELLKLVPKLLVIGIGCRKEASEEQILKAVYQALEEANCMPEAVAGLASIDLKKEENGILSAANRMRVPFHTYSAEELKTVAGDFEESDFVESVTGVGNVCQRAAMMEAEKDGGWLIKKKKVYDGVTIAIARKPWKKIVLKMEDGLCMRKDTQ